MKITITMQPKQSFGQRFNQLLSRHYEIIFKVFFKPIMRSKTTIFVWIKPIIDLCTGLRLLTKVKFVFFTFAFSSSSYAALTATTANIIQGSQPYILLPDGTKLTNADELLSFVLPDGSGGTKQYTYSDAANVIFVPSGTKTNELTPLFPPVKDSAYQLLDNLLNTYFTIGDDEGDASLSTNTSALGKMRIRLHKNGLAINPSNDLFDGCARYELKIQIDTSTGADQVTAKTTYGIPNEREYTGNTSVTYRLLSKNAKFCSIETGSSSVYNTSSTCGTTATGVTPSANGNCKWEGGYNPVVFDGQRFDVAKLRTGSIEFPTTGFKGAQLTFYGPGGVAPNFYKCKVTGGNWVSVISGSGCNLVYESIGRPTTDITVELRTDDLVETLVDTYVIKAPKSGSWAENVDSLTYYTYYDSTTGTFDAADYCAGTTITNQTDAAKQFFLPSKITNVPNLDSENGRFSRDADGTFMGEWGNLTNNYSTSSPFYAGFYWAADTSNVYVMQLNGSSLIDSQTNQLPAVCKR